jgi:hypothetical protein
MEGSSEMRDLRPTSERKVKEIFNGLVQGAGGREKVTFLTAKVPYFRISCLEPQQYPLTCFFLLSLTCLIINQNAFSSKHPLLAI